jgi:hypothetical protein
MIIIELCGKAYSYHFLCRASIAQSVTVKITKGCMKACYCNHTIKALQLFFGVRLGCLASTVDAPGLISLHGFPSDPVMDLQQFFV